MRGRTPKPGITVLRPPESDPPGSCTGSACTGSHARTVLRLLLINTAERRIVDPASTGIAHRPSARARPREKGWGSLFSNQTSNHAAVIVTGVKTIHPLAAARISIPSQAAAMQTSVVTPSAASGLKPAAVPFGSISIAMAVLFLVMRGPPRTNPRRNRETLG